PNDTTVIYDIATNKWTKHLRAAVVGHSYDTNVINPVSREYYAAGSASNFHRYKLDAGTFDVGRWGTMKGRGGQGYNPSVEYFPDRDELLCISMATLEGWKRDTGAWKPIPAKFPDLGIQMPALRYDHVRKVMLIVGGSERAGGMGLSQFSHAVCQMAAQGTVT